MPLGVSCAVDSRYICSLDPRTKTPFPWRLLCRNFPLAISNCFPQVFKIATVCLDYKRSLSSGIVERKEHAPSAKITCCVEMETLAAHFTRVSTRQTIFTFARVLFVWFSISGERLLVCLEWAVLVPLIIYAITRLKKLWLLRFLFLFLKKKTPHLDLRASLKKDVLDWCLQK